MENCFLIFIDEDIKTIYYVINGKLNLRINLTWAFAYNLVMIPISAGVFFAIDFVIDPMISSAAMSIFLNLNIRYFIYCSCNILKFYET